MMYLQKIHKGLGGEVMNPNKLRAMMALYGDSGVTLAKALGMSQQSLSAKINGKRDFTQREIWRIKERYDLTPSQVDEIFFAQLVS